MTDEPFSALLEAAFQLHELHQAYVQAGFTEDQALELVKTILAAATPRPNQ
jgi:hypothetical protein